jgi:diguanylate cyclase (GGDEF)-like protein/PAS domain S-box-containing protein
VFTLRSSISAKIIAAFGVIFLIVLTLGGLAIERLDMINDLAIATRDNWLPSSQAAGQLRSAIRLYRLAEARVAIAQGSPDVASYAAQVGEAAHAVTQARAISEPLIDKGTDEERLMRDFDAAWAKYRMTSDRLVRRVAAGGQGDLQAEYFGEDTKYYAASVKAVTDAITYNVRSEIDAVNTGQEIYRLTRELAIAALVVAAAVCGVLGMVLIRFVSMPVKDMTAAMNQLAAHDITVVIPGVGRRDELGAMAKSLDVFKASLIETTQLRAMQDEQNVALQASEARFRTVFNYVNEGIFVSDASTGQFIEVNQPGCDMFGFQRGEVIGRDIVTLSSGVSPYTQATVMQWVTKAQTSGPQLVDWQCKAKDGHLFWAEISLRAATFGDRNVVLATLRDIGDRKEAQALILQMARHDGLTGLANRNVFAEAVARASAGPRRDDSGFAVFYLDLDHFKDVNDTLGHAVGDELLRAVAGRLQSAVRETDTVARFGGDEFAVMSTNIRQTTDLAALGDKLIKALGDPFSIQGNDIRIGTSIGIAVYGLDAPDAETLLSHADVALYRAKAEGRGAYRFFTDAMDTEIRARVTLLAELRDAIGSEQLFLLYQPQVEMATGRLVGLEALVRWRHPRRGILGPDVFIREAENSGLIVALSRWVLQEACRQGKVWLDARILPPGIAVNLSAAEFKTSSQVEQLITTTLANTGFPAGRLEIELTETVLMDVYGDHYHALARLRARGIKLAIDDFGTGFSSLDYLRRFPADRIKIDQSFIRDLETMPGNVPVVKATIALAREMGMAVIAEGVETQRQVELLTAWGCREAQGFYFAQPLTPEELAPLLRSGGIVVPHENRNAA